MPITGFSPRLGVGAWELLQRGRLETNATTVTISGLDGDVDELYMFVAFIINAAGESYYSLRPNNTTDMGTCQYLQGLGFYTSALSGSDQIFPLWAMTAGEDGLFSIIINAHTGVARQGLTTIARSYPAVMVIGSRWTNTVDNITSFVFAADQANGLGAGTAYWLFRVAP